MEDDFSFLEEEEDGISDVSETLWGRFSSINKIAYIGYQDGVLVTWSASIAKFYEIGTKTEKVFAANNMEKDGIACLAGHPNLHIWAFGGKNHNPEMVIVDYPELQTINSFWDQETETFELLDIAFIGWDLLVVQAGIPKSKTTVWNWKTSELIYAYEQKLLYPDLALRVPMINLIPGTFTWAMFSFLKNKFYIWELYCVGKIWNSQKWDVILEDDEVTDMIWSPVTLYVTGAYGDIYQLDADKKLKKIYHNVNRQEVDEWEREEDDEEERKTFHLTIYNQDTFYMFCPGNTGYLIKYENDNWTIKWESLSSCKITSLLWLPKRQELYATSEWAELMILSPPLSADDSPSFKPICDYGFGFISIQWVNPLQEHILALTERKTIIVMEKLTGSIVNVGLDNVENCLDIVTSPKYSYVILCKKDGQLDFYKINLDEPFQMISTLNVSDTALDTGQFNAEATLFVTCCFEISNIFIIKVSLITKPEVIGHILLNYPSVTFWIQHEISTPQNKVFLLKKTETCCDSGNQVDVLLLKPETVNMTVEKSLHFNESYLSMENKPKSSLNVFIGIPHRTYDVHVIELRGREANVVQKQKIGHQIRFCHFRADGRNKNMMLSWSLDGDIIVHSLPNLTKIGIVSTHHRYEMGVAKCIIDKNGEYIVALGKDATLIGVKTNFPHIAYIEEITEEESDIMLHFKPPPPEKITINLKSWELIQEELRLMQEKITYAPLRKKVVDGLKKVQDRAAHLLEENFAEQDEDARLPLEDFDLDVERQMNMEAECQKIIEESERQMKDEIERNNKMREEILEATWNKMEIHARNIKGINNEIIVQSYSLPFMKKKFLRNYKKVIFQSKLEMMAEEIYNNHFYPWVDETDIPEEELVEEEEGVEEKRDRTTIIRDRILKEEDSDTDQRREIGEEGDFSERRSHIEKRSMNLEKKSLLEKGEEEGSIIETSVVERISLVDGTNNHERRSILEKKSIQERKSKGGGQRSSKREKSLLEMSTVDRLSIHDKSLLEKSLMEKRSILGETEIETGSEIEMEEEEFADNTENYPEMPLDKCEIQFSGSNAYQFVKRSPYHYNQFEMVTEGMMYKDWIISKMLIRDLSLYFNKEFNAIWDEKESEIRRIKEKNERIRFLMEEINFMSQLVNDESFVPLNPNKVVDLEWTQEEKTELMVQLQEWEVPVKPYISPSQQALLDQKAAEEEALRLALLADDFRERALMKMMDGVLEVRWEDEIKRDIPKPRFMEEKDPGDYNIDDLKAVKDYEEKVAFLNSERERYRRMCDTEMKNLQQEIWENGNRFDEKLLNLYNLKLQVEAAITQETFKFYRLREECYRKLKMNQEEMDLIKELESIKNKIDELKAESVTLKKALNDQQHLVDTLPSKEQQLNKNYKKDFHGISPYLREHLQKLYRRRPKIAPSLQNHVLQLRELNKYLHGEKEYPSYLTREQLEVLRAVEYMDSEQYMPGQLTVELWHLFCKHRRLKMEHEIKVKYNQLDLAESESAFAAHERVIHEMKSKKKAQEKNLATLREKRLELSHNKQIQLVLPSGQVELEVTGELDDFDDAVILARSDIAKINKQIIAAGNKKLEVVKRAAKFKVRIQKAEWENQKLKMRIEDLKEDIYYLEHYKLMRDMRTILILRKRGIVKDYGPETLEALRQAYRKMFSKIEEREKKKLDKIDRLIKRKAKENEILDKKIIELNVQLNEQQLMRDIEKEKKDKEMDEQRLKDIMQEGKVSREINKALNELLKLNTKFELKKLRTFPILTPHPPDLYFKTPPGNVFPKSFCKGRKEK